MIAASIWALAVIAFLAFFFRGHLRWLLLWLLGLAAVVASVLLQVALEDQSGYVEIVAAASRVGWGILVFAIVVLAADLAVIVVYILRRGADDLEGEVVTENRPLSAMYSGYPSLTGWSKRKTIASKTLVVAMRSLVDGTASAGERGLAGGIVTLFVAFFLIWVGAGLILTKQLLVLALLPILPGLFVYYNLRAAWSDYRKAKRRAAAH